ncbi:hypothetical protein CASFOL_020812 [Castilleja foliolosa]|uniref:Uncharacterized protein n=1 Tax=Castilleja foliolosa TaxID=1961234 RepID=A0ABD3D5P8_9LAMI
MAETQQKRLRSGDQNVDFDDSIPDSKRPKPYNTILSLLDEEDEEQNQDLSAIFTTLQQEITSSASFGFESPQFTAEDDRKTDGEDGVESVMRHLLEASDDELGIPSTEEDYNNININFNEIRANDDDLGFANFFDNGIWELEDVAANYYTLLQSELFM